MSELLEFRPKRVLLYFRILAAVLFPLIIGSVITTVVAAGAKDAGWIPVAVGAAFFLMAALSGIHTLFYFHSIVYELGDTHLVSSKGVLWRVRRSTPLEKITNIDVRQGPLANYLGVGDVWIFTPSTGTLLPEEMLSGVENPHQIRKALIDRAEALKTGSPGPARETAGANGQMVPLLREIAATLRNIESKLG
jgi:membrane protein YdbS with pleckstrin-like domain